MPTARRSRTIEAPVNELWEVVSDPHHLPRWWPRVTRVEDVREGSFTQVMRTARGRTVRADYDLVALDDADHVVRWEQRIEGTPFANVLRSSQLELRVAEAGGRGDPAAGASEVTIELRQELPRTDLGTLARFRFSPGFGSMMVKRAAAATIEEALAGLERIHG